MNRALIDTVKLAAGAAGWRLSAQDSDEVVRVDLEDDLHVVFQTPDGVRCVASCDLGPAPKADAADDPEGDEALRSLGTKAAALMPSQASVLSIHEGRLELSLKRLRSSRPFSTIRPAGGSSWAARPRRRPLPFPSGRLRGTRSTYAFE